MAACQLGSRSAVRTEFGKREMASPDTESAARAYRGLGLTIPARAHVSIGWTGAARTSEGAGEAAAPGGDAADCARADGDEADRDAAEGDGASCEGGDKDAR